MDDVSKYVLAWGAASSSSLRNYWPPSFVPPPVWRPMTAATEDAAAKGLLVVVPNRSLVSSWLPFGRDRDEEPQQLRSAKITQTLRAPLESFESLTSTAAAAAAAARTQGEQAATATAATAAAVHFGTEHGLLCLERGRMPHKLLRGLGSLADAATPFKAEALHSSRDGEEEEWLDTLTDPFFAASSNNIPCSSSQKNGLREEEQGDGVERRRRRAKPRRNWLSPNDEVVEVEVGEPPVSSQGERETLEALRWLKADVKRIAQVFAREISSDPGCEGCNTGKERREEEDGEEEGEQESIDVTVKLELLGKGKCPRFHLDKVPLRLICTYVGPTTEWLDGYDPWEMEHNRSLPPACNAGISGGREARHARAGDVLIFRGQQEGQGQDAPGVAHRSPDMVEGQRRLVLTMDVGNIIASSAS